MEFPQTDRNTVRRIPARGHYDHETVHAILDAGYLCQVAFCVDQQPFIIPTLYGRDGERMYLHGAAASRLLKTLSTGVPVCLSVTHVDGLVLARSAFHHSMNYRSVVVFGTAQEVDGNEKEHGLFVISEQVLRGRWEEVRGPNQKELAATSVVRVTIESASAKIRTGGPKDEPEDYDLPIWAGVVPLQQVTRAAIPDEQLASDIALPDSVRRIY